MAELKTYDYRRHEILQTETRHAETRKRLYAVTGPRFQKTAATRPFLPSTKAAREWLDEQYSAAFLVEQFKRAAGAGGSPAPNF